MKLLVLMGQRKEQYPGEYAVEALACMDETNNDNNPDYLLHVKTRYNNSNEFESLKVIAIEVDSGMINSILFPEEQTLVATNIGENHGRI